MGIETRAVEEDQGIWHVEYLQTNDLGKRVHPKHERQVRIINGKVVAIRKALDSGDEWSKWAYLSDAQRLSFEGEIEERSEYRFDKLDDHDRAVVWAMNFAGV